MYLDSKQFTNYPCYKSKIDLFSRLRLWPDHSVQILDLPSRQADMLPPQELLLQRGWEYTDASVNIYIMGPLSSTLDFYFPNLFICKVTCLSSPDMLDAQIKFEELEQNITEKKKKKFEKHCI